MADTNMEVDDACDKSHFVITDEEFITMARSMNVEQTSLFYEVHRRIQQEIIQSDLSSPLKLFISGAAGSGKTFLLKAIAHHIQQCYTAMVDPLSNARFVEVTALTGVEARLARGKTLHKAFSLSIENDSQIAYSQTTEEWLKEMRKWRTTTIRWLIIDGMSMVSYEVLRSVHQRLQELKANQDIFGGINVLVFGDIMQLGPVKGNLCFQQPPCFRGEPDLWRCFGLRELRTNVRQQNDGQFGDLLNNLRIGAMSTQQYELLLGRSYVPLTGEFAHGEAIRIFPTNRLVDEYNERMVRRMYDTDEVYILNARDECMEFEHCGVKPDPGSIPQDPERTGGLPNSIVVAIGARVTLCRHIHLGEGLLNGSMGVVRRFEWYGLRKYQCEKGELPNKIFIEFDDESIGGSFKDENGWVAVEPLSTIYRGLKGSNIKRTMFPLTATGWAATVHKMQGTTVKKAVIYLGESIFATGQAYVSLSRVKSLNDIAISELDLSKLFDNLHDEDALAELERMRNDIKHHIKTI